MKIIHQKKLVVLASTFPRWQHDTMPRFVLDYAISQLPNFSKLLVLVPHYKGAAARESLEGVSVQRFRYAYPASLENIVYESQGVKAVRSSIGYTVKLGGYMAALLFTTLRYGRGADVINAHWLIPQGFIAVLVRHLTGARIVISIHGGDVFTLNGRLMRAIKRYAIKHADAVVVNSSATKVACQNIYPHKDYPVIPMGIDIGKFKKPPNYQRKDSVYTALFVGRLSSEKGLLYLCDAMKRVYKKDKKIRLIIVGDGPQKEIINKYIIDNNQGSYIIMAGWQDSMALPDFYYEADLFVGPSVEESTGWKEAFGLVFAEAATAGVPVIGTKTGGIPDVVLDGKTGILVDQKNPEALATAILKLKNNPKLARKMGAAGAKHVADNFSWTTIARRYYKILHTPDA